MKRVAIQLIGVIEIACNKTTLDANEASAAKTRIWPTLIECSFRVNSAGKESGEICRHDYARHGDVEPGSIASYSDEGTVQAVSDHNESQPDK